MIIVPICLLCKYLEKNMKCKEYPNGIPTEILLPEDQSKKVCDAFSDEFAKNREEEA